MKDTAIKLGHLEDISVSLDKGPMFSSRCILAW